MNVHPGLTRQTLYLQKWEVESERRDKGKQVKAGKGCVGHIERFRLQTVFTANFSNQTTERLFWNSVSGSTAISI